MNKSNPTDQSEMVALSLEVSFCKYFTTKGSFFQVHTERSFLMEELVLKLVKSLNEEQRVCTYCFLIGLTGGFGAVKKGERS